MSINVNDGPLDSNKSQQKTLFGQFRGVVGGLGLGVWVLEEHWKNKWWPFRQKWRKKRCLFDSQGVFMHFDDAKVVFWAYKWLKMCFYGLRWAKTWLLSSFLDLEERMNGGDSKKKAILGRIAWYCVEWGECWYYDLIY